MTKNNSYSLEALVRVYQWKFGPKLERYLGYWQALESLEDAIRRAAQAKGADGKINRHQRRVGEEILGKASKVLLRHVDEFEACKSFEQLHAIVERYAGAIERFGVLAVYDTSLRIGQYLSYLPKFVYLHAGTKKGCKALGLDMTNGVLKMSDLPKAIQVLEPYQAEDFLCVFKGRFKKPGRMPKECLPGRRPGSTRRFPA